MRKAARTFARRSSTASPNSCRSVSEFLYAHPPDTQQTAMTISAIQSTPRVYPTTSSI